MGEELTAHFDGDRAGLVQTEEHIALAT
jgi:hypothetical protein